MSMRPIDLRSDTVTQPTQAMRRAMADAKVGDDVYGEDPTVNQLEQRAAEIFEREAALFVPTGTMANQIAIKIYAQPGQEVICEQRSHILNSESGMMAVFAGCIPRAIWAEDGILTWEWIAPEVRAWAGRRSDTGLITIENTANFAGGTVYPVSVVEDICRRAHSLSLPVFLDGARVFNAAVALDASVVPLTQSVDSLMFCLSKSLGAPAGSLLVGSVEFIAEARRLRKMLGGGMRQIGILAAAGLVALEQGPARLHLDHEHAQVLARGLAGVAGLDVAPEKVVTNIVVVETRPDCASALELASLLRTQGVLANAIRPNALRMVTHCDITRADCERAAEVISEVLNLATR